MRLLGAASARVGASSTSAAATARSASCCSCLATSRGRARRPLRADARRAARDLAARRTLAGRARRPARHRLARGAAARRATTRSSQPRDPPPALGAQARACSWRCSTLLEPRRMSLNMDIVDRRRPAARDVRRADGRQHVQAERGREGRARTRRSSARPRRLDSDDDRPPRTAPSSGPGRAGVENARDPTQRGEGRASTAGCGPSERARSRSLDQTRVNIAMTGEIMEPIETGRSATSTAPTWTPTRSCPSSSSSGSSAPASVSSCSTTGRRSPTGTCRPTRSSSPARTSAAAPRASTRPGGYRTTASRRSWRRPSQTSSTPTAPRSGCCRSSFRRGLQSSRPRRPRQVDLREQEVRFGGRQVAVRDRPRDPPPPARRARRHRADAPAG